MLYLLRCSDGPNTAKAGAERRNRLHVMAGTRTLGSDRHL